MAETIVRDEKWYWDQGERFGLPDYMIGGLVRYIVHGIQPGHFLTAVLSNDLRGAFERADETNVKLVPQYLKFLYNAAPLGCWGNPDNYNHWLKKGGLNGSA